MMLQNMSFDQLGDLLEKMRPVAERGFCDWLIAEACSYREDEAYPGFGHVKIFVDHVCRKYGVPTPEDMKPHPPTVFPLPY